MIKPLAEFAYHKGEFITGEFCHWDTENQSLDDVIGSSGYNPIPVMTFPSKELTVSVHAWAMGGNHAYAYLLIFQMGSRDDYQGIVVRNFPSLLELLDLTSRILQGLKPRGLNLG